MIAYHRRMANRKVMEEVAVDKKQLKSGIALRPGRKTVVVITDARARPAATPESASPPKKK